MFKNYFFVLILSVMALVVTDQVAYGDSYIITNLIQEYGYPATGTTGTALPAISQVAMNKAGHLAFIGVLADGRRELFFFDKTDIYNLTANFTLEIESGPAINDLDQIIFVAEGNLYLVSGYPNAITINNISGSLTDHIYAMTPAINNLGHAALVFTNENGLIAGIGYYNGQQTQPAIFLSNINGLSINESNKVAYANGDVFVIDPTVSGGNPINITNDSRMRGAAPVINDRGRIAFIDDKVGNADYLMYYDGSMLRQLALDATLFSDAPLNNSDEIAYSNLSNVLLKLTSGFANVSAGAIPAPIRVALNDQHELACRSANAPYDIYLIQRDRDNDLIVDVEDNCPEKSNPNQLDTDGDGLGDACDTCPKDKDNDKDKDGVCGDVDNCPINANTDQADSDKDGKGNVCDSCPLDANNDKDKDGVCGDVDNCPDVSNSDQFNQDGDTFGDVCDTCPKDKDNDKDKDSVCGDVDNCPDVANTNQANQDGDTFGDVCDSCPLDANNDADQDGVCGNVDNCPEVANTDQSNLDGDLLGDLCDTCPLDANNDADQDGVCGNVDNCPDVANPSQENLDQDGIGDLCDDDQDGDGYTTETDCDDRDSTVYPGAEELCDQKDNDCNTKVDDRDMDADTYIAVECGGDDCNDQDAKINPGVSETYHNGIDDNCDGTIDSGVDTTTCGLAPVGQLPNQATTLMLILAGLLTLIVTNIRRKE
jgi:hypothetical protein